MRPSPLANLAWLLVLAAVAVSPARAAYVVTFSEVGPDVVATGSGTIDIDGMTFLRSEFEPPLVSLSMALVVTGVLGGIIPSLSIPARSADRVVSALAALRLRLRARATW